MSLDDELNEVKKEVAIVFPSLIREMEPIWRNQSK